MKKLWNWFKAFIVKILDIIKGWFIKFWENNKVWIKKNWFWVLNYIVLFITFAVIFGRSEVIFAQIFLGIWMGFSIICGIYVLFTKNNYVKKQVRNVKKRFEK